MPGSTATPAPDGSGGIDNAKEPREFLPDGANPCECSQSGLGLTETPRVTPRQRLPSSPELRGNGFARLAQAGAAMGAIRLLLESEKWEESKESPGLGKHTQGAPTQRGCLITNPASQNTPSHHYSLFQLLNAHFSAGTHPHPNYPSISRDNPGAGSTNGCATRNMRLKFRRLLLRVPKMPSCLVYPFSGHLSPPCLSFPSLRQDLCIL